MSEITRPEAYRVDLIESELGWGQKVDSTKYFDNEQEANKFVAEFNTQNSKTSVPDWYMYAVYIGQV